MKKVLRITILMDNPHSWFVPYAKALTESLLAKGHDVALVEKTEDLRAGDIAFFLSVESLVKNEVLARNKNNIVIHGSKLPAGKGWSPLTWQILEGKDSITITLFEAAEKVDSGDIYLLEDVHFDGTELIDELRKKEADAICRLALKYVENYPIPGVKQAGEESFYPRRKPEDSALDPARSLAEHFNLLRIVDNDRYPAYFEYRGKKYILKIYKAD